jgi:DnaJ family protein C protein 2
MDVPEAFGQDDAQFLSVKSNSDNNFSDNATENFERQGLVEPYSSDNNEEDQLSESDPESSDTDIDIGLAPLAELVARSTKQQIASLFTNPATKRQLNDLVGTIVDLYQQAYPESTKSIDNKMIATQVALPLPVLPEGWTAEKDFKAVGTLSPATERSIEPVGPHFLAHARRARHKRTFSEDDRIQAQHNVKKVEDDDAGEISEPEDPSMLLRDAKDWKVCLLIYPI